MKFKTKILLIIGTISLFFAFVNILRQKKHERISLHEDMPLPENEPV